MVGGSCLCGGVQFQVAEVPLIVLCHCSICRKANGAAFDAGAAVPVNDFELTKGEDLIRKYESSPGVCRSFCRVCGFRVPSKAPWWPITDDLPQFEEWVPGYGPEDQR